MRSWRQALAVGVGVVGPERIDEINILQATYEAMRMAVSKLKVQPDILLNDAVTIPDAKGSARSPSSRGMPRVSPSQRPALLPR